MFEVGLDRGRALTRGSDTPWTPWAFGTTYCISSKSVPAGQFTPAVWMLMQPCCSDEVRGPQDFPFRICGVPSAVPDT